MGYLRPSDDIPSVVPPHLYMTALALAMSIQIGKEHIIPHIMIVEIGDVEHSLGTHLVAMNHNGGSAGRLGGIEIKGMSLIALRHQQEGVFHAMMLIHRVHPDRNPGTLTLHSRFPMFGCHSLFLRIAERIIEHIAAYSIQTCCHKHNNAQDYTYYYMKLSFLHVFPSFVFQYCKITQNNKENKT